MNHIAEIYNAGDFRRYQLNICWKRTNEEWRVENSILGKYYQCKLKDKENNELAVIKYQLLKSMIVPHYDIFIDRQKVMGVSKKISLGFEFRLSHTDYQMEADEYGDKWKVYHGEKQIIEIRVVDNGTKKMCYQVDTDSENRVLGVCICAAIDLGMRVLSKSEKR